MSGVEFIFMIAVLMFGFSFRDWAGDMDDARGFFHGFMYMIIASTAAAVIWT